MKISFNWLKTFIEINENPQYIANILTDIGLDVTSTKSSIKNKEYLQYLLVGQIISIEKHPNADKLQIVFIEIKRDRLYQVVCGDNNIKIGQKVIFALPPARIKNYIGEVVTIKKNKIRGELSEGMLCSEYEIGISDQLSGIANLNIQTEVGCFFIKELEKNEDHIFEMEITPNRGDACSHLGVARDLSAALDRPIKPIKIPDIREEDKKNININIENNDFCYRYSCIIIDKINIKESPSWLKTKLLAININPKNNVIDITNYIMHSLGNPMHAYDYDKINGNEIIIGKTKNKQIFQGLNNINYEINSQNLPYSITDKTNTICLPGIIGDKTTAISSHTSSILLECAYFNPIYIQKISKQLSLTTDASYRFARGTSYDTITPIKIASQLITEITCGNIASRIIDKEIINLDPIEITLNYEDVLKITGIKIPVIRIKKILKNLGFTIIKEKNFDLTIKVPTYKSDITRPIDIVAEIMRIYGYNNMYNEAEDNKKTHFSVPYSKKIDFDNNVLITNLLVGMGYNEIRTNPMINKIHAESIDNSNEIFSYKNNIVYINNPISNELSAMRNSMVFSGLDVIERNINEKQLNLKFFEFGTIYARLEDNTYLEKNIIALFLSGKQCEKTWITTQKNLNLENLILDINKLLNHFGIIEFKNIEKFNNKIFNTASSICYKEQNIAQYGEIKEDLIKKFSIPQKVFYTELYIDEIKQNFNTMYNVSSLSKYPTVIRDLSFIIDNKVTCEQIKNIIDGFNFDIISNFNVIDIFYGDLTGKDKKSYTIQISFNSKHKTLRAEEINKIIAKITNSLKKNFNAEIR